LAQGGCWELELPQASRATAAKAHPYLILMARNIDRRRRAGNDLLRSMALP
jgi:hypothetical protein